MVWELSEAYGLVALSLIFPFSFSWLFFLFGLLVMKLHLIYSAQVLFVDLVKGYPSETTFLD